MDSQSPVADTLLGKSIGGYQIVKRVGQSNLSTAYLAQSQKHGQAVIFTTFTLPERFSRQARERFNERFMRVVAALVRLRHSHIAPVYDFGMQPEYLYMITALTPADTLATLVPRQPHLSTTFVLDMMRQIAEGIDYAHRSGVIHGSLSSSNILLDSRQQVQIAGFSLVQLLALSDIEPLQHPYTHVLSVAMTFLGNPYSIAPEVVQGAPVAPAADIYALGILLYEMLSGQPPFVGADPLKTALARINTSVPSLGELRPDLPLALDRVVQKALSYDPVQRYASGGSLVQAFEQALRAGDTAKQAAVTTKQSVVLPAMNEQNLDDSTSGSAQASATYSTGDINQRANQEIYQQGTGALPISAISQQVVGEGLNPPTEGAMDPFARWSPATLSVDEEQAFTWVGGSSQTPGSFNPGRRPPVNAKRRRLVTALVAGGVVLGGLGGGGAVLAHLVQGSSNVQGHAKQVASNIAKPTPTPQPTKTVQPSPTAKPKPSPTAKPKPSPTPTPSPAPSHTGVVVGSMNQGNNTSTTFTNPADDNDSLLIRLPNGNFVAFESDCPHEGVTCHYDAGIQKIVCPRHTAYFDPFNNAAVLQGPPKQPLPSVPVHINSDGTVTVG